MFTKLSQKKFSKALASAESNCHSMDLDQLKEFKEYINEVLKNEISERKLELRLEKSLKGAGIKTKPYPKGIPS